MSTHPTGITRAMTAPATLVQSQLTQHHLDEIPDVQEIFRQSGWVHKHMAHSRWINPLLGKVAFLIPLSAIAVTSEIARRLGYDRFARETWRFQSRAIDYMNSVSTIAPLVRTVNSPQEPREDLPYFNGVCLGSSLYFSYLYERLVGPSTNAAEREAILIKCANLFVEGAPKEACQLHCDFDPPHRWEFSHCLYLVPDDLRSVPSKGTVFFSNQAEIQNLANGSHLVLMDHASDYHALLLIKCSNGQGYLFDPALGLFKFTSGDFGDQLVAYFNREYRVAHKYNYFQGKGIPASRLGKLWIRIFPMNFDATTPQFTQPDRTLLAPPPQSASRSLLGHIATITFDKLKAAYF